jgi:hypothetical protein
MIAWLDDINEYIRSNFLEIGRLRFHHCTIVMRKHILSIALRNQIIPNSQDFPTLHSELVSESK